MSSDSPMTTHFSSCPQAVIAYLSLFPSSRLDVPFMPSEAASVCAPASAAA